MAIEFAMVGGFAVLMLFGSLEAARYQFTQQSLRVLAGEAARAAAVTGTGNMNAGRAACTGLSGTMTGLNVTAPFLIASTLRVTLSGCATQGSTTSVKVTVTQPFAFSTPVIPVAAFTMTETTQSNFR